ncbi:MAG TPA: hypothetical protein VM367_02640 [Pseudonocardia sp.]|nr:hypothetical protein [Pseudonocardia sp.]
MQESELVRRLKDLAELRAAGSLSNEEFAAAKAAVLDGGGGHGPVTGADTAAPAPGTGPVPPRFGPADQGPPPGPGTGRFPGGAPGPMPPVRFPPGPWGPPGPPSLVDRLAGRAGAVTCIVAGVVAVLTFLMMPMITEPFTGRSATGPAVASVAGLVADGTGALSLFWFVPIGGLAAVVIGAWQVFGRPLTPQSRRAGSVAILVLAGLALLVYLVGYLVAAARIEELGSFATSDPGVSTFVGVGYWFGILAMLTVVVGAVVELVRGSRYAGH